MIGKPCFLPCFEYVHSFLLQSFLLWFQSCSLSGSFWPYRHFPLPVSPPSLPGLARSCEDGEDGEEAGGSPGDPEEMGACGPRKGSLRSRLTLGQARQPLAMICWKDCPFSFYSLKHYFLPFPFVVPLTLSDSFFFFFFIPNSSFYSLPKSVAVKI